MARRAGGATSPNAFTCVLCAFIALLCVSPAPVDAGLYGPSDLIVVLSAGNVESVLLSSSAALLVEFYATWCGHCVAFSPVWKNLARDIREWKPAVDLAAIDCADEGNRRVCSRYGITGYPSLKFFPAYSSNKTRGQELSEFPRDVRGLRHYIINRLETHNQTTRPPACPPLETTSEAEIDSFFQNSSVRHLALVFENKNSYVGREVTLDLLQYENVAVRRVLDTDTSLVSRFGVTDFPSCYLYESSGNISRLKVLSEARTFYSYALRRLPGVTRTGQDKTSITDLLKNSTQEQWRPFNKTRVYMADLESALHYSLRVELAAHVAVGGADLKALQKYVSVLAKYFPGRPSVQKVLQALDRWLQEQHTEIQYSDLREVLEDSVQTSDAVLPEGVRWVGCQGSQARYRGYPCAVWTLFHVLTVQAKETSGSDPQEVLQAMRGYVRSFFGCRACSAHFETMAQDIMNHVTSLSAAVLWLWSRHNRVNNRLAGHLSEDPHFPKIQWPSPELCPSCHGVKKTGEHSWNYEEMFSFLKNYYSSDRILSDYLQDETQALLYQRNKLTATRLEKEVGRGAARRAREVLAEDPQVEEQGEEDVEEPTLEKQELEGMGAARSDMTPTQEPWEMSEGKRQQLMQIQKTRENIVDLDSFVSQHYKAKALHASEMLSVVRQRSLQTQDDVEDLQFEEGWRLKRDLGIQEENLRPQSKRWMSFLSLGLSRLDVSLCVLLYLLSTMCLIVMFLCFKQKIKLQHAKLSLP